MIVEILTIIFAPSRLQLLRSWKVQSWKVWNLTYRRSPTLREAENGSGLLQRQALQQEQTLQYVKKNAMKRLSSFPYKVTLISIHKHQYRQYYCFAFILKIKSKYTTKGRPTHTHFGFWKKIQIWKNDHKELVDFDWSIFNFWSSFTSIDRSDLIGPFGRWIWLVHWVIAKMNHLCFDW